MTARARKPRVTKTDTANKNVKVVFDNVQNMIDYIKDTPEGNNSRKTRPEFVKHSWDETLEMLQTGWGEGIKEVDIKASQTIDTLKQDDKITYNFDVTGEFIDIGLYVTGTPECFLQSESIQTDKPVKKIVVNLTASYKVDQE